MIRNAFQLAKYSGKVLFRNKGMILIAIVIPFIASLMINLWKGDQEDFQKDTIDTVHELSGPDVQMAYIENYNCMPVKVYDRANNEASQQICEKLAKAGVFQIFRVDSSGDSYEAVLESAKKTALRDKVGAMLVLEEKLADSTLFSTGEDPRFHLLEETLKLVLSAQNESEDKAVITYLQTSSVNEVDYNQTKEFSYCVAVAAVAFIFGGVLILGTILSEKRDNVYSRVMLSKANQSAYLLSKGILIVGLSLVQSLIMTLSFVFCVRADIGINPLQFFCTLFSVGIIFSCISVCLGIYCNSISGAAFLAFTIWSMSNLLAGTFFDISGIGEIFQKLSLLVPQRWALLTATRFIHDDIFAFPFILCVTLAYLLVILVVGIIGLRIKEED